MSGVVDDKKIVGTELLQLRGKSSVDAGLSRLLILQIDDLRLGHAALPENIDERVVSPILDRKRPEPVRIFSTENADSEDPRVRWLTAKIFGSGRGGN